MTPRRCGEQGGLCTWVMSLNPNPRAADLREAIERAWSVTRESGTTWWRCHPPLLQRRHQFPVLDLPLDQPIVGTVTRNVETVTGEAARLGRRPHAGLPRSHDTGYLRKAGIPCVLYGPMGPLGPSGEADGGVFIGEMETCAKVIASSVLEFCQRAMAGR
jgi:acetylornithine deacetylase/succinyl-diaminopimelate desuccinylase-like protein